MKDRVRVPARVRALLQQETESKCPICGSLDVGEFQIHHLDGRPDNNIEYNLLLLCPTCHAKLTNGALSPEVAYQAKKKVYDHRIENEKGEMDVPRIAVSNSTFQNRGAVVIGDHAKIIQHKKIIKKYPDGSIGSDTVKANYISYLISRYNEFAEHYRGKGGVNYAILPSRIKKHFKIGGNRTYNHIPISQFDDVIAFVQAAILNTKIGRMRKGKQRLFSTYDEYCSNAGMDNMG